MLWQSIFAVRPFHYPSSSRLLVLIPPSPSNSSTLTPRAHKGLQHSVRPSHGRVVLTEVFSFYLWTAIAMANERHYGEFRIPPILARCYPSHPSFSPYHPVPILCRLDTYLLSG